MEKIAAILMAAHAVGDFLLQPNWLAAKKHQPSFMLLHVTIHAFLAYVVLQAWACWQVAVFVLVIHAAVDLAKHFCTRKHSKRDTAGVFALDQACHVLGLLFLAWLLVERAWLPSFTGHGFVVIVGVGGFAATVLGSGFLIAKCARRIVAENRLKLDGLLNGGKLIGQLERALIFLFIFIGQPTGIGFLVAAKSILRFEEARKQQLAEYVLIGTLLSFSLAVALASATKWALTLK